MEGAGAAPSTDPIGDVVDALNAAGDADARTRIGAPLYQRGGEGLMHRIYNECVERAGLPDALKAAWATIGRFGTVA